MKRIDGSVVLTLGVAGLLVSTSLAHQQPEPPVAIVAALSGTASVTSAANKPAPLALFDRISASSTLEVARGSMVTLVFLNGARYELGESATATTGTTSITSSSGPVRRLEPLPSLPRFLPIAGNTQAGPRSGAVRIRGAEITHLYPGGDTTALADSTVLQFGPLADASRYRVEVDAESGARVFEVETQSSTVTISPGVLIPGARYYWQVRSLDRAGQAARGTAEFTTLSAETARERAALKAAVEATGDATSLALLAELDRSLGLLREARDGFRAALARAPDQSELRRFLDRVEQRLAAGRDQSMR